MSRSNVAHALHGWGTWSRAGYVRKGEYDGECWRAACIGDHARWLNEADAEYYCASCAKAINDAARRAGERPTCFLLAASDVSANEG